MGSRSLFPLAFYLLACLTACTPHKQTLGWNDYKTWLAEHQDVLSRSNTVEGVKIKVSLQPNDYLAYKELLDSKTTASKSEYDSIRSAYGCSKSFKLEITTDNASLNLIRFGITTKEAYTARINFLSFHADEFISMKVGERVVTPAMTNYEMYNELRNKIVFTAVFTPQDTSCNMFMGSDEYAILFDDPIWNTGKHYFRFEKSDITRIPTLKP